MIELSNGHKIDFACASGALAFDGQGWWWEHPLRWLGIIDPTKLTIITKTLTLEPTVGNLNMWCPWRCVQLIPGGAVNAIGLTNPGLKWWIDAKYKLVMDKGYNVLVSIMPKSVEEAVTMAQQLDKCVGIKGIQVNVSCPNVTRSNAVEFICETIAAVEKNTSHPVIVKLSFADDYVSICKELDGTVSAFELINTVPFPLVFPGKKSPLNKFKLVGGVSGEPIRNFAIEALQKVKAAGVKAPIMSGGGIMTIEDVRIREKNGADAFVLGSVFLRKPWRPNQIVSAYRKP
jgi:dihydroorotate dehydrogenase (NAD+) catalytic subunit